MSITRLSCDKKLVEGIWDGYLFGRKIIVWRTFLLLTFSPLNQGHTGLEEPMWCELGNLVVVYSGTEVYKCHGGGRGHCLQTPASHFEQGWWGGRNFNISEKLTKLRYSQDVVY